jgi:hypothetical protein
LRHLIGDGDGSIFTPTTLIEYIRNTTVPSSMLPELSHPSEL